MRTLARWIVLGGLVLVATSGAQSGPLTGAILFNTGNFLCDGQFRLGSWAPPPGQTVYVKSLSFEMGMSYNGVADFFVGATRASDGAWIVREGWDRYQNPTGPFNLHRYFSPDWFLIGPGDSINFHTSCTTVSGPVPTALVLVTGLYTVGAP